MIRYRPLRGLIHFHRRSWALRPRLMLWSAPRTVPELDRDESCSIYDVPLSRIGPVGAEAPDSLSSVTAKTGEGSTRGGI